MQGTNRSFGRPGHLPTPLGPDVLIPIAMDAH